MSANNWAELSIDILGEIVKQLPHEIQEFIRFSTVCKPWRSYLLNNNPKISCSPWLMLAKKENDVKSNDYDEQGIRSFYIVSADERILNLSLPTQGRRCWGTPYGWLFTLGYDLNINLFNPLSQVQISLPSQTTFVPQYDSGNWPRRICRSFIKKVALTSNPQSTLSKTLVMAIYGEARYLACASPGDEVLRRIDAVTNVADVVFYNGYFYVVSFRGIVSVIDIGTTPPIATIVASPPEGVTLSNTFYLIELFGELHFVERLMTYRDGSNSEDEDEYEYEYNYEDEGDDNDNDSDQESDDVGQNSEEFENPSEEEEEFETFTTAMHTNTKAFRVFKFDSRREWNKVDDLGEYALFLGNNTSFAISTLEYPHFKGNCIYFTDDHVEIYLNGFCDMGVYDFSNGTVSTICPSNDEMSTISRPVFFMPTTF